MIRRHQNEYILRALALPVAIALGVALLIFAGPAFASETAASGPSMPASRWSLFLASSGLALLGLFVMGLRRAWFELTPPAKAGRVFGVALVALGFYGGLYSLTEAPPGGESVEWVYTYEEGRQLAEATGLPMMIDFTADWCGACQELEAEVFQHPETRERLERDFIAVKIDYDERSADTLLAVRRFEVTGLPRVAFETWDGTFLQGVSFEGKVGVDDFNERLDRVMEGAGGEEAPGWLEGNLGERGLWVIFLLVFGAGVLSSLSPCIYPLIPITIGIFGARQATSRREGFLLSLTYVGGIVVTYSILGMMAALLGTVFGGFMQNIWLQGAIAAVFVLLGLGCLGVYELRLPGWVQKRLSSMGGIGHLGAFVMGLAAGVIAAPCIGPVVAGILVYVAQQGDVLLGWALLTSFAVGMGLLFVALGTFSSLIHRLPRAGGWMDGIKAIFGAVFLGLGLYYFRLILPPVVEWTDAFWLLVSI